MNWFLVAICLALVGWGCAQSRTETDADQERDPSFLKAKSLADAGDYQGAAAYYEKALLVDPQSAPAHLELGLLYDEKLGDPILAVYHYRQYLALRPDSDKQQLVQDFIERAKLSLAAKLPQAPSADPNEVARLQSQNAGLIQENLSLKARVAELERAASAAPRPGQPEAVLAPVADVVSATSVADHARSSAPVETAKSRTHVIEKGDTLQSLALKYYGTRSAWDRIYQANRNVLLSKDQLRVGQVLVLP